MIQQNQNVTNNWAKIYLRLISNLVPPPKVNHSDSCQWPPLPKSASEVSPITFAKLREKLFLSHSSHKSYFTCHSDMKVSLSVQILYWLFSGALLFNFWVTRNSSFNPKHHRLTQKTQWDPNFTDSWVKMYLRFISSLVPWPNVFHSNLL